MLTISINLSAEEISSLEDVAGSHGETSIEFITKAIKAAIVSADPERQGPINHIRSNGYPQAMGPFEIIEAPVAHVLAKPLDLTKSALQKLQNDGVALVNIRFLHHGAVRQPDFSVKELLG
jgi:hypothetical protein